MNTRASSIRITVLMVNGGWSVRASAEVGSITALTWLQCTCLDKVQPNPLECIQRMPPALAHSRNAMRVTLPVCPHGADPSVSSRKHLACLDGKRFWLFLTH
jgi:hypothetical protein